MKTNSHLLRVLYLEDNPLDADLARRELARSAPEIKLETASTICAALARLKPESPPFDLVLTDLSLPDGSGLELLAQIRERGLSLAVVILTGTGDQEAVVAALKAGADDYLVKRGDYLENLPQALYTAYASYREGRERRARPLRVLYAEPNRFDADLTRRHLTQHAPHIRLDIVGNGEEVMARFPSPHPAKEIRYEVLMLDYRLPVLNALEVVKVLRLDRSFDIPIILVTGHGNEDVAIQALRLGVNDYLLKDEAYLLQLPAVIERAQKEAELNKSEKEYRKLSQEFNGLLDAIPDSIMLLDRNLKILWTNRGAAECVGSIMKDLTGRFCHTIWYDKPSPCESCPAPKSLMTESILEETLTNGNDRTWEIRAVPLPDEDGTVAKVIVLKRDITEQKKLKNQFLHAQKMESIGTLAGGVAHDFNNILQVIVGFGHLTLSSMNRDDKNRQNIESIMESVERATQLTKKLLLFSRKEESERSPVDLNDIIGRMGKFLQRIIGEDIVLKQTFRDAHLPILADDNQLDQVLMNLAVNARDAMPHGGEFKLMTDLVVLDERFTAIHGYGKPGSYALLTVSDTGTGMAPETMGRIFEPFYTTKEPGKGTGLGLSVVYGIIRQHDGFINVYSEPGYGTTFRIYLPVTDAEIAETGIREGLQIAGGTETILLAEDDESVRGLMECVLREAGYKVITTVNGREAIQRFRENEERIQLLLFDLVMPVMSGKAAADEIHRIRPGMKTIFASGYAADVIQQKVSLNNGSCLISKPVSPTALLRKVRNLLDGTL